ncbi:MAG: YciI family protein [Candidatus Dormibacteraeota bacterium]|nr:YciI family protein [Candidatus Dormibacteraeota bacterium]
MKYVLLFGGTMEPEDRAKNPALAAAYERINQWFDEYGRAGKIVGGHELQGPQTATTVRFKDGKPMVVDGPFIEAKEVIGGYAELEVEDLDEALQIAKTWPGGTSVEVRPIVES